MLKQFINDNELIELYQNGKESALEPLIKRHQQKLFSYILLVVRDRQLAEDVFQDTFIKAIQKLKKREYKEEGKFYPWIKCIAHNLIVDQFRFNKKMPTVSNVVNHEGEETSIFDILDLREDNVEDDISRKETRKEIKSLIDLLPQEQKEIVFMRHYLDMSFREISELTNISLNTALGRMRYAIINLRKLAKQKEIVFLFVLAIFN
jgi:RNA polymerase sigma factor (sigma-70 family)